MTRPNNIMIYMTSINPVTDACLSPKARLVLKKISKPNSALNMCDNIIQNLLAPIYDISY